MDAARTATSGKKLARYGGPALLSLLVVLRDLGAAETAPAALGERLTHDLVHMTALQEMPRLGNISTVASKAWWYWLSAAVIAAPLAGWAWLAVPENAAPVPMPSLPQLNPEKRSSDRTRSDCVDCKGFSSALL